LRLDPLLVHAGVVEHELPIDASLSGVAMVVPRRVFFMGLKEPLLVDNSLSLDLVFTKVTDKGLKELTEPKKLQSLNLVFTKVTDNPNSSHLRCKNQPNIIWE
jgi:hypothetical protein